MKMRKKNYFNKKHIQPEGKKDVGNKEIGKCR